MAWRIHTLRGEAQGFGGNRMGKTARLGGEADTEREQEGALHSDGKSGAGARGGGGGGGQSLTGRLGNIVEGHRESNSLVVHIYGLTRQSSGPGNSSSLTLPGGGASMERQSGGRRLAPS